MFHNVCKLCYTCMFCKLFSLNNNFKIVGIKIFSSGSFILDFFNSVPITHDSFIQLMKHLLSIYYILGSNLRHRGQRSQLSRENAVHETDSLGVKIPMSRSFILRLFQVFILGNCATMSHRKHY